MEKLKLNSFLCTKSFYGGILNKDQKIENIKTYRFRVTKNDEGTFDCIPEYYSNESGLWVTDSFGWNVQDVIDSKGLFLNFGTGKVILPSEQVWDEIRKYILDRDYL